MLRNLLTSRTGRALCAASIGLATLSLTVAATNTVAGAATATPSITSLSPTSVSTQKSSSVTITGKNLIATGYTTTVFVGSVNITPTSKTATTVKFASPSEFSTVTSESVKVQLTKSGSVALNSNTKTLTYTTTTPPAVTSLSPTSGPASGGTVVTITGTHLTGATTVDFGTTAGSAIDNVSSTEVKATSPAESPGVVDVIVHNPSGTSITSSADHFTYTGVTAAPTVTGLTPTTGPIAGGSEVTITGTNLTGATAVAFGGTAATGFTVNSATSITASSPAGSAGTVNVTVTTPGGTSATSSADDFTYNATPSINGLSPVADVPAGGTSVTINGLNLAGATAVNFGSDGAGTITADTATSVTATDPAGTAGDIDNVTVTTAHGTTAIVGADKFTYEASAALPPASLIIGSGSATTYDMMGNLGDIFQESPGCDLTNSSSSTNQINLSCSNAAGTSNDVLGASANGGESGLPIGSVNPFDDYYANAPATGSSNGRNQVLATDPLTGGPDGISAFNVSFARSSSYSANAELNYVGYATDGVSWVSLACINSVSKINNSDCTQAAPATPGQTAPADATPHWDVTDISKANLVAIWDNNLSCTINGNTVTMDWRCLEQAEGNTVTAGAQPIDCYTTQTASGTYSTWQGYLGFAKPPLCASNEAGDPGDSNSATDHVNLTENQMGVVDAAPDAEWAIYFMSYGKFVQTCSNNVQTVQGTAGDSRTIGQTQGTCIGQQPDDVTQYGSINGINADAETIQGTGDRNGITFPDPRTLYNVYGNTTSPNPANPATLNFIGAGGFLCRADMAAEIDPNTGLTYRTEIENAITSNGFFPLDINQSDTFTEGTITKVPTMTESVDGGSATNYYPGSSSNQNGSGSGYCVASN
jgi:hypothetical protein